MFELLQKQAKKKSGGERIVSKRKRFRGQTRTETNARSEGGWKKMLVFGLALIAFLSLLFLDSYVSLCFLTCVCIIIITDTADVASQTSSSTKLLFSYHYRYQRACIFYPDLLLSYLIFFLCFSLACYKNCIKFFHWRIACIHPETVNTRNVYYSNAHLISCEKSK